MSKTFFAKVKSVLSGDTLVLTAPNNPKAEKTVSLAYVSAPRLSKDGDEPYAFQSREFLRELVVGKQIQCTVVYQVNSGREFVSALLSRDGPSLPDEAIKAGWLKVREEAGRKDDDETVLARIDNLRQLESDAKDQGKGLWAGTGGSIEVQNDLGGPDFMKQWKGKTVDGIVERVLSGDRLLVRLLLSDKKHVQVMTLLAGVRSPSTERTVQSTGQTQPAEEFGNEAKSFVEERLLQRRVKVDIVGASAQGQLVAALIHPNGNKNIAEFLLQEGLARCNDFHSTMLGEKMAALRAAEKAAQDKKLRLHQHHVAKAGGSQSDMIVAKIIGADTIIVRNKAGTTEKRINLSSVRGPRTNEPSEAPYRDEAKEFLRKKVIGKHVHVTIDGSKPAQDGFEARDVATVTEKGKNIGLILVEEGYATVIRHRKDDTDRASNYDELLAAQEKAKEEKKGIWSGKAPKLKQWVDASESVQKAKIQLATLQRQKKVPAIVDFVKSGSRFTVLIPREGVKLTLVLGGVRAPRAPGPRGEKGEEFGAEAADLANRRLNQRDVEVDIYDIDKVGGYIGDLYVNRESFAKILVEEGLASVHAYSAEKSGNAHELFAAEKKAKEGRKGLWHSWDPSQDEEEEAVAVETTTNDTPEAYDNKPKDYRDVVITNIDGNGKIKIQEIGKGTAALTTLMNDFKKFHLDSKNAKPISDSPKTGDFVAAKFSADGQWYRARIRSNDRAAKVAEVVYIDYGNTEKQPWSKLRPLDQAQFTTQKLKAQAIDASLSFLQLPNAPHYLEDSIGFLAELTEGRELVASFDFVDTKENLSYITLFDYNASDKKPGPNDSLNKEVVANGMAMVPKKLKAWERSSQHAAYLKHLKEVEAQAKEERLGMWEYGDITED
ncbi:Staphylococcal nuclease domain-containing protein 1 [Colletotrichum fructicola]|uniref:Probable endonuclease LCL3 n=1 Tax=Colletotrichum fructicola (strain Nara gc5) TaxID=1213859 RepID=L2GAU6_COLFN|nr:Nuclease domain-containing protein 1 [Colletotrichum fructicola]KAF4481209.1 Staphylococcal nuclease domain-containing protein 1 [Colletotrichum fructicola Nara gc5]KAE9570845.1 Nuclease domain-containing protein 1 [Colletotrichum fructicola]KAF4412383.1 Staphylococcal nuclease domain-containing protein 1 [Colletotrichum fructicola]KAF4896583.1 Staphylococcal nuclease domain-containing protein 1 [Colletotrichum fructicola]KAF4909619.1 Staphylococcal nuclease domain-containing protein 1 [Col